MKTMFLDWQDAKAALIAKDPVTPTKRWMIRKNKSHAVSGTYQLVSIQMNGNELNCGTSDSVEYLKWQAVVAVLHMYADRAYRGRGCHSTTQKERDDSDRFLCLLSEIYDFANKSAGVVNSGC